MPKRVAPLAGYASLCARFGGRILKTGRRERLGMALNGLRQIGAGGRNNTKFNPVFRGMVRPPNGVAGS